MIICNCNESFRNTGLTDCQPLFGVMAGIYAVPTYDSTGARNKLSQTTLFTPTLLLARINDTDKTKRYYPIMGLENVNGGKRADAKFWEAPSGAKRRIQQGDRETSFEILDQGPEYEYQLEALSCGDVSVFVIDKNGSLRGMDAPTADGFMYPIRTERGSWDINLILANDGEVERLAVSFQWGRNESDSLLRIINASDMTADLLNQEGLLDVSAVVESITTTVLTISLFERFGTRYKKNKIKGLLTANAISSVGGATSKIRNTTSSTDVTVVVAEQTGTETRTSGPGTYTLTFTAQTSGHVLQPAFIKNAAANAQGFDFTDVLLTSATIP